MNYILLQIVGYVVLLGLAAGVDFYYTLTAIGLLVWSIHTKNNVNIFHSMIISSMAKAVQLVLVAALVILFMRF